MRKDTALHAPGMAKIQGFCQLAARRGFEWAWIDTCSMHKRSSAEVFEAIDATYK